MTRRIITDALGRAPKYDVVEDDGAVYVRNRVTGVMELIGTKPYTARDYNNALHRLAAKEGTG